jgi:preprotein translocase subunit SecG
MYTILIGIFVIVSFLMTFIILIQSSKGHGLAGTFGGTNPMGSLFGGRGSAPFLSKATGILAALFMVIALILGMITRGSVDEGSLVQRNRERLLSSPARTLPQANVPEEEGAMALPPSDQNADSDQ